MMKTSFGKQRVVASQGHGHFWGLQRLGRHGLPCSPRGCVARGGAPRAKNRSGTQLSVTLPRKLLVHTMLCHFRRWPTTGSERRETAAATNRRQHEPAGPALRLILPPRGRFPPAPPSSCPLPLSQPTFPRGAPPRAGHGDAHL